jgi:phosphatidylinositol alpha-1,6-mannosyltransferase
VKATAETTREPWPRALRVPGVAHRTLLLAPELFASDGGIPRILRLYLKALCELGDSADRVRFVALNDSTVDTNDLRRYTTERLGSWRACRRSKTAFIRAALTKSRASTRIVCGHVAQLPVALAARCLQPRLTYDLVAHGIEVWRPFSLLERLALRGVRRVFCVSEFTRREFLRQSGLPSDRAVVLPNALDPFFPIGASSSPREKPPVILTVTRLNYADRYKGVETLIAAMPAIRAAEPDACLRIVGQGDDRPRLEALAKTGGVLGRGVEFLGFVDDEQLRRELRSARIFALPSESEGFGLVFLEAMANGLPCVGARAGGTPEVITDATGVLVTPHDPAQTAAGCLDALRRDWAPQAMLDRARAFSYELFRDRLASQLIS